MIIARKSCLINTISRCILQAVLKDELYNCDYWIEAAKSDMPAVTSLVSAYRGKQPLKDERLAVCVIPTAETGVLVCSPAIRRAPSTLQR